MTAHPQQAQFRRGLAFLAGVSIAALPTIGPFIAIITLLTSRLQLQRADLLWWLAAVLLGVPYVVTGHPADAGLTVVQVLSVWIIYRAATEFRRNVHNATVPGDVGAGLVVGLAITLALGLRQMGEFRFDVAKTVLDAVAWSTHPAMFGHAILVLAALVALVVPSPRLRVVAMGLGAIGVIFSGSLEAAIAWLVIAVLLRFVGRRGTRSTRIAEWVLVGMMALVVTGVAGQLGLGRTGFVTSFVPVADANQFRGTEVLNGDWWHPLGVRYSGSSTVIDGQERTAITLTKDWAEPWSRLQQAVTLEPGQTYTLSAAFNSSPGSKPGFDGWGRESSQAQPANLGSTLTGERHEAVASGAVTVLSSSAVTLTDEWVRAFVTFRYDGERPLTWYVGVVPDRSTETGVMTSFAELQLTSSYMLLPYRPGPAASGVADLRTSRLPIWRDAIAAIGAKPLLGWGPQGFAAAVNTLRPDEALVRPVAAHAHNALLDAWIDRGFFGLLGLVGLFGMLSLRAVQQRDRAAIIVLIGVVILNMFDSTLLSGAVIYPLAAVLGWRAVGHRSVAEHETGAVSATLVRLGLAGGDYLAALCALGLTGLAFGLTQPGAPLFSSFQQTMLIASAWPIANSLMGQYPGYGRPSWQTLQASVIAALYAGGAVIVLGALAMGGLAPPPGWVLVATFFSLMLTPLFRSLTKRALHALRLWGRPVVMIGSDGSADVLTASLLAQPLLGLRPVALLDETSFKRPAEALNVLASVTLRQLPVWDRQHAIVQPGSESTPIIDAVLGSAGRSGFRIVQIIPTLPHVPSSDVVARPLGRSLSLEVRNSLASRSNRVQKRIFDLLLVGLGAVAAAPLVGIIALAIRLDSKGPAFYNQKRVGRDGKHFRVWKFRTMVADAETRLQELLANDPEARAEWNESQKLVNDPRVTRVGGLLRKTSLDELPQLWNVLKGEMSLVGPRPIVDDEVEKYGDKFQYYTQVRPGMTGAWQVSGRSDTSYEFRVDLDTYYVRNWNIWLDLDILVKTVQVVLKREGAY